MYMYTSRISIAVFIYCAPFTIRHRVLGENRRHAVPVPP